jgi:hypothetical protein
MKFSKKKENKIDTASESFLLRQCKEGLLNWDKAQCAAYSGNADSLLDEINNGYNVNKKTSNFVSYGAYKSRFSPFYDKKKKTYFQDVTLLYLAAQKGNLKCVELLLNKGADLKIKTYCDKLDKGGSTPLSIAILFSNYKCFKTMKNYKKKKDVLLFNDYTHNNI